MNDDDDMFQDLRLGEQLQNIPNINTKPLGACRLLEMATRGGAIVTGIEGIGSLDEGNWADLVLLSLPEIEGGLVVPTLPLSDILVRRAKGSHVRTVMIGGKLILKDRKWISLDVKEIVNRLRSSTQTLAPELEEITSNLKQAVRKIYGVSRGNNTLDYTFNNYYTTYGKDKVEGEQR
jgi:hypothetical protein